MDQELEVRLVEATERGAKAQEELIRLATEERDTGDSIFGPPLCPHCGTFNPTIRNEGGDGEMSRFVLVAECSNCEKTYYAVPQGWLCFTNPEQARDEIERRNAT